jgi:hypothetical protein
MSGFVPFVCFVANHARRVMSAWVCGQFVLTDSRFTE